jgi:hypothetical protein
VDFTQNHSPDRHSECNGLVNVSLSWIPVQKRRKLLFMKRLGWLLLLSVVTIRPAFAQDTAVKMLEVTLRSRSSSCRISDNLELEIIRENVGSHDLVVPRSLAWGGGRTNIWVYDDKGKEVVTTFLADELPPPPQAWDFVVLDRVDPAGHKNLFYVWIAWRRWNLATWRRGLAALEITHDVAQVLFRHLVIRCSVHASADRAVAVCQAALREAIRGLDENRSPRTASEHRHHSCGYRPTSGRTL